MMVSTRVVSDDNRIMSARPPPPLGRLLYITKGNERPPIIQNGTQNSPVPENLIIKWLSL